jgi:hypothetical protein
MAMSSISAWIASDSMVIEPSSSAVVPRMTATSMGNEWYSSHSCPRSSTTSTRSSVVRLFCLPPVWRGSTYVAKAHMRDQPRPSGGDLTHQLGEDALGEGVRLQLVVLDHCAESGLVADVASDRAPMHARERELAEAAVGEVTGTDYRTDVRSRGWPVSLKTVSSSSMNLWGSA